jgi:regulatory protein
MRQFQLLSTFDAASEVDLEAVARDACLRALARGPRTRAQLAQTLRQRRIPDEVAESVLGRLAEVGLVDDADFAAAWVDLRHHGRGLSRDALARELGERGVDDDVTAMAVDRIGAEEELATAQRLVARQLPTTRNLPAVARARKLCGMLARKGYSPEMALHVVLEALRGEGVDLGEFEEVGISEL